VTKKSSSFLIGLLVLAVFFTLGYVGLNGRFTPHLESWRYFGTLAYFLAFCFLAHRLMSASARLKPGMAANRFLAMTFGKLFISVMVLLAFLFIGEEGGRKVYIAAFLAMYLVFSGFLSSHATRIKAEQ
jgi:hypothetical protein